MNVLTYYVRKPVMHTYMHTYFTQLQTACQLQSKQANGM